MRRLGGLILLLAWPGWASAQSLDYGALEQIFGEPVTRSATGTPLRATEVPADMQIITADMIRRSGARSIPDILAGLAGVDIRRYGSNDAEVNVGGYLQPATPRLLVLINGRQVYLDDYGHTAWATLPVQLQEIRQIEVVKGPASALFGFNALSGVVNIVTYDPIADPVNAVTVQSGTQDQLGGSAVASLREGDLAALRLSAGEQRQSEFAPVGLPADERDLVVRPKASVLSASGEWRPISDLLLGLESTFSDARYFDLSPPGGFVASSYRTRSFKGNFSAETGLGTLSGSAYHNELDYAFASTQPSVSGFQNGVTVAELDDLFKPGASHSVRVALEYRDNANTDQPLSSTTDQQIGYRDYAGSATWEWQILPELSLVNSVRIDRLGLYVGGIFPPIIARAEQAYDRRHLMPSSYNSGLVWKPDPADTLRLLIGRGVETPSLIDFGSVNVQVIPAGPGGSISGPQSAPSANFVLGLNLAVSQLQKYEISWDHDLPAWASSLTLSVNYQQLDDILSFSINNLGHSRTLGTELGLHGESDGFHWNGGFVLRTVRDALLAADSGPVGLINFERTTPNAVAVLGAGWAGHQIEADLHARWTSGFTDIASYDGVTLVTRPVDAHVTLGGRLAYAVTSQLTLALTGEQLTQARQTQSAGLPIERQMLLGATVHW